MSNSIKQKTKADMILAIVFMSMYLNIENVLSLMLYDMTLAFPEVSEFTIQKIPSNMYLIQAIFTFAVGWINSKISKRKMIIIFQSGTMMGALIGYFFADTSFAMVYVSLFVLSISAAVMSTISRSVVVETFSQNDVPKMISVSQISNTIGAALINVIGGHLIAISWKMGYLTFLIGMLSLFSALFFLPEGPLEIRQKDENTGKKENIWTKYLIHDVIITMLFLSVSSAFTTNISFLVAEKGFGNAVEAGYIASAREIIMFIAALLLPYTMKVAKKYVIIIAGIILAVGYSLVAWAPNIWLVVIGAGISGFGMGTFTPAIFVHIAKHVTPNTNATSHAMISVAGTFGIYLYPYVITLPAGLLGEGCTNRFIIAIALLVMIIIGETVFQKNEIEF